VLQRCTALTGQKWSHGRVWPELPKNQRVTLGRERFNWTVPADPKRLHDYHHAL